jgi:hypothetical protein
VSFCWAKAGKAKLSANPTRETAKGIFIVSSRGEDDLSSDDPLRHCFAVVACMWCCTLHVYNIKTYIATYILMLISGPTRPFIVADPTDVGERFWEAVSAT